MQTVLIELPPMFDEMLVAFPHLSKQQAIFSWGPYIYNPWNHVITQELYAHEDLHAQRQGAADLAIRRWWRDYIDSPVFRLEEEIPAHRAEYRELLRIFGNTRSNRRRLLRKTAERLRNPLYGYNHLISIDGAMETIALAPDEARG